MFYVKWLGQVILLTVLIGSVALLVPPPAVAGSILIFVIAWALWLLTSLARHLFFPKAPKAESSDPKPAEAVSAPIVSVETPPLLPEVSASRSLAQRVKDVDAGNQRTCSSRIRARLPRESRGRSFSPSFIYCRARRRLSAARA